MTAVADLHARAAVPRDLPLIIFNGELDRLRGVWHFIPGLTFCQVSARLSATV
jgi:hypothetical protein